ncbi:MAG: pYEATS domain-containing protein [bacterium]
MPGKSQKLANILTIIGAALVAFTLFYSIRELRALQAEVGRKKAVSAKLNTKITELNETIERIKFGPIAELLTVKAIAIRQEGRRDAQNRQLYNFMLWLDLPEFRKKDIEFVKYYFDDPSMLKKERIGKEVSNGFAINYLGYGCLRRVKVTVVLKQHPNVEIDFPMCERIVIQ